MYIESFKMEYFIRGLIGSITDNLGMAFVAKALSMGPAGPILGLVSMNSVILTIFEALRTGTSPNLLQTIGLLLGIIGAIVFSQEPSLWGRLYKKHWKKE